MRHIKKIAGRDVIIQSCWLDEDSDIQANIGITNGLNGLRRRIKYCMVQISPSGELSYPNLVIRTQVDRIEITHQNYDEFLRANLADVMDLIISLLEIDEVSRWKRTGNDLRDTLGIGKA